MAKDSSTMGFSNYNQNVLGDKFDTKTEIFIIDNVENISGILIHLYSYNCAHNLYLHYLNEMPDQSVFDL